MNFNNNRTRHSVTNEPEKSGLPQKLKFGESPKLYGTSIEGKPAKSHTSDKESVPGMTEATVSDAGLNHHSERQKRLLANRIAAQKCRLKKALNFQ